MGGVQASASLARGFEFHMESVRALLAGGVAFDTPEPSGMPAKDEARFELYSTHAAARRALAEQSGLHVVVETPELGGISQGDPVLYRETRVGDVLSSALHPDGRSVGIRLRIDQPYAALVRTNTRFWNASGVSADLGLTGLHVHTESLAALMAGGIALATPDAPGAPAADGSVFRLYPKAEDKWHRWSPRIWMGPGPDPNPAKSPDAGGNSKGSKPSQRKKGKAEKVHFKPDARKDSGSHHWFQNLFHRDSD